MKKIILIFGLSGSGKTTLASNLCNKLKDNDHCVTFLNADEVRTIYNDWDFSLDGRIRQAKRMQELANKSNDDFVIIDFIAPISIMRDIVNPDYTVWVDTVLSSQYSNTDKMFIRPCTYDYHVTEKDADTYANNILSIIL